MKWLILLTLFSCTQKFQTYHIIDKHNFKIENYEAPIAPKLRLGRKVSKTICNGQVFFSSNAQKRTIEQLERSAQMLCPHSKFLLNSRLTESWWTTIAYSKSCMTLETYCPLKENATR